MIAINPAGYFVTGSDTDVGKTYIAAEIVAQLVASGVTVETRKPAESGCDVDSAGILITHDAQALRTANGNQETIERICPFRFRAALAPHRAARLEGKRLALEQLIDASKRVNHQSCLLIEGAGGFYSPLAEDGLNADLAAALQLSVIIVVDDRIGAVNQSLMTIQAVTSRGLEIAALILNEVKPKTDANMDNAADLKSHCTLPIFICQYGAALDRIFEEHR